jgi:hypothetical protein
LEHEFYDLPYIGNNKLPFDELIFFRGVETTNQIEIEKIVINQWMGWA